jgi:hypothetical protein
MVPYRPGARASAGLVASGAGMDPSAALSQLVALSAPVVEAVVVRPDGVVAAAHAKPERTRLAAIAAGVPS